MVVLGVGGAIASVTGHGPFARRPEQISCGIWAALMIWLGTGSILARRWARALSLCFGGVFFISSLAMLPGLLILMATAWPKDLSPWPTLFGWMAWTGIAAGLLAFYSQPNVKSTCDRRDPTERWTDRCSLPVLACSILLVYLAFGYLRNSGFSQPVPVAGIASEGTSGRVFWLVFALFTIFAAIGIYRRNRLTWALYLTVFMVVNILTFIALVRINQSAGPDSTLGPAIWNTAAGTFMGLGYLIYARLFFGEVDETQRRGVKFLFM